MTNIFAGIEGINSRLFRVIYSKDSNRVYISYNGERLMTVTDVSDKYYIDGKNGMQIGKLVLEDNEIEILNMILGGTETEEDAESVETPESNEVASVGKKVLAYDGYSTEAGTIVGEEVNEWGNWWVIQLDNADSVEKYTKHTIKHIDDKRGIGVYWLTDEEAEQSPRFQIKEKEKESFTFYVESESLLVH